MNLNNFSLELTQTLNRVKRVGSYQGWANFFESLKNKAAPVAQLG